MGTVLRESARKRHALLEPAGATERALDRNSRFSAVADPDRSGVAQQLITMTADEWQAHVTREAAKAMGQWLEGRGRLHQPIATLTLTDLELMAGNAIARFIVLASHRIKDQPDDAEDLTRLLLG
jgi:hypothetical protein